MAKISDLVKTYRMLSDPNAPDWNVKFVGALAAGILLVAATAGGLWWATHGGPLSDTTVPAAEARTEGQDPCCEGAPPCEPPADPAIPSPVACPTNGTGPLLP